MYANILVPIDGSPLSGYAVGQALELAAALSAKVTFFTTVEPFQWLSAAPDQLTETRAAYDAHVQSEAGCWLREAEARAQARGIACQSRQVVHEDPHAAIIDAANANGCDLIAMASHGRRGVKALVLGSVTAKVLTHSQIPVLVYRTTPQD